MEKTLPQVSMKTSAYSEQYCLTYNKEQMSECITHVLKNLHWLQINFSISYTVLTLCYKKSFYYLPPSCMAAMLMVFMSDDLHIYCEKNEVSSVTPNVLTDSRCH